MSFILDALKKLEQNRKRGEVPDLSTVHLHEQSPERKKSVWPYLLLAALFLNAGIITAWLRPWEEQKDVIAEQEPQIEETIKAENVSDADVQDTAAKKINAPEKGSTAAEVTDENKPEENTLSEQTTVDERIEQALPKEKDDDEVIASMGLNPSPEELNILRSKIKEEQQITDQVPLEEVLSPAEPVNATTQDNDDFIEFDQLPGDIKKELPKITINGHIYSDNSSARIANINGYITREGDKVASGLFLDEITASGVILSYGEYRFRIRAF